MRCDVICVKSAVKFSPTNQPNTIQRSLQFSVVWRGGAIGLVLDQQARGRQFDHRPFHCYTATQSKSRTHVCDSLRTKGQSYQLADFNYQ